MKFNIKRLTSLVILSRIFGSTIRVCLVDLDRYTLLMVALMMKLNLLIFFLIPLLVVSGCSQKSEHHRKIKELINAYDKYAEYGLIEGSIEHIDKLPKLVGELKIKWDSVKPYIKKSHPKEYVMINDRINLNYAFITTFLIDFPLNQELFEKAKSSWDDVSSDYIDELNKKWSNSFKRQITPDHMYLVHGPEIGGNAMREAIRELKTHLSNID